MPQSRAVWAMFVVFALIVCAIFFVPIGIALVAGASASCDPTQVANQPSPSSAANSIPANYLALYQKAGRDYGLAWNVLAGIGEVETDHGRDNEAGVHSGANPWGAMGPMQFLQDTWNTYGVDGDGDGKKDVYDPADAIPGAANYLRASGAPGDWHKAIFTYNHADWYVNKVLRWASVYAAGNFSIGPANGAGSNCVPGGSVGGAFGQRVVAYAKKWIGTTYVWGGGDEHGPTHTCGHGICATGFDCSGLTLYAIYQASGGKIDLGHYTGDQFIDKHGQRISSYGQLQIGDLMFFAGSDGSIGAPGHVAIYEGGDRMVEAPFTGANVRESSAKRSDFAGGMRFGAGLQ